MLSDKDLINLLDQKAAFYNQPEFIINDPISIPHQFDKKEDIEIAGFLTALISWGRRDMIIKTGKQLMNLMNNKPFDFITNKNLDKFKHFESFYYRTLKGDDLIFLLSALRNIYIDKNGLEAIANDYYSHCYSIKEVIIGIRDTLLKTPHLKRSEKHLSDPASGSAAKRINMFLRWMVRKDKKGVDFGIWQNIPQKVLMCPLDVHSGRIARKLGLLQRKQDDWKAVEELTNKLRSFDLRDPVKYDFALYGMGAFEGI